METYILALDQGTTSSRCIIYNKRGRICSMAQKELTQIYPEVGWVEHDPMEIWSSQLAVTMEAMAKARIEEKQISCIGITNQRETTIVWDKETGRPIYNAIVWQCRRTAETIDKLNESGLGEMVRAKTGLIPDAYFSASKIQWILDHVPNARKQAEMGKLLFGTVDTWLIWNLTQGKVHVTDYTNASRTMLFDIEHLKWDDELLDYFDIPKAMMPDVKPSSYVYGYTDQSVLGREIPIAGAAGDQQAALFGQCCFEPGEVKNTYGTGCFLLMNTGGKIVHSKHQLLTTIAASGTNQIEYALEGSVFVAGAAIGWLRDGMRMIREAKQCEEYARRVESTEGLYIVPAFTGMGAPYWEQYAKGTVLGITRATKKEHFIRATLESIAYQTYDVLKAMEEDAGTHLKVLKTDGGASINDLLMQFQADILETKVDRPKCIETTSLGAAYLAGLAVGYWKDKEEIKRNWELDYEFVPKMPSDERNKLIKGWKRAIKTAIVWANEET